MKSLAPLIRVWKLAYYRWARFDMAKSKEPQPDLGYVLNRIAELEQAK